MQDSGAIPAVFNMILASSSCDPNNERPVLSCLSLKLKNSLLPNLHVPISREKDSLTGNLACL